MYNTIVPNCNPIGRQVSAQVSQPAGYMPVCAPLYYPINQTYPNFTYPSAYYVQSFSPQTPALIPDGIKTEGENGSFKLTEIQKSPFGENIYKYILKNGQTVALLPRKNTETILKTCVNSGSLNENETNGGISHFVEHNVFNGSKTIKPGEFFKETGKLGLSANASTETSAIKFYLSTHLTDDETLKKMIEIQSDMLSNPAFPPDMLQKEKEIVISEINMQADNEFASIEDNLIKRHYQIQTSNSGNIVAGKADTIKGLEKEDVENYFKAQFTPDNMYTVLVGDFDVNKAIDLISKNFTKNPSSSTSALRTAKKLTPIEHTTVQNTISKNNNYDTSCLAFSGPLPDCDKDKIALDAINAYLFGDENSKLNVNLSKVGAHAGITTEKIGLEKNTPLFLETTIISDKGQAAKGINEFYNAVQELKQKPLNELEMQNVKEKLLLYASNLLENSELMADETANSIIEGRFYSMGKLKENIANLTPNDIMNAARKYFDFNKTTVLISHGKGTKEEEIQNKTSYCLIKEPCQTAFGGNNCLPCDIPQYTLPDNTNIAFNNVQSDKCYINRRLKTNALQNANPSAAKVLEEMLKSGIKNNNGIETHIKITGGELIVQGCSLNQKIKDTIFELKNLLYTPSFTEENFKKAVDTVYHDAIKEDKTSQSILAGKIRPNDYPAGESITEGLKTLTLDEVKKLYNNFIFNSTSNVAISTSLNANPDLEGIIAGEMNTAGHKFKQNPAEPQNKYQKNDKEIVYKKISNDKKQADIGKAYTFKISGNIQDEVKFEMLNLILGGNASSRLFQDLRESKKLAYTASSTIEFKEDTGALYMNILSTTDDKNSSAKNYDNLKKSLEGFKSNTDRLQNELISDEELLSAKINLKQKYLARLYDPQTSASVISNSEDKYLGTKRIALAYDFIDSITKEDIKAAANYVFSNKPIYAISTGEETFKNNESYLVNLGEIQEA